MVDVLLKTKQKREDSRYLESAEIAGKQDALRDWPRILAKIEEEATRDDPQRNLKECCVIVNYSAKGNNESTQSAYGGAFEQAIQELLPEGFKFTLETSIFPDDCSFSIRW
ncbi:MAG: hypothetical protein UT40_C0011G0021 [Candidatus Woesebacteria bacterium GW2011_GWA1_39_21b]|uniref:Uncharacterized protein n=1 Tax=Candidatus Woesebacteria bacterium GW2011_GWA1_39_21b TaxID=1618551 RepID=A0A0G0QTN6_9BACT|nr:MAG: hypothetical protein UT40_C0011G0021 [Candidatus Woesebacteria bacterium GW2011_GWA1_39_21b]